MSFLSVLGNIGKGLIGMGGGNAGDIANKVAEKLGQGGQVASGAAQGAMNQRLLEHVAGLRGAEFDREGQNRQLRQQMLMQLLNNTQDFSATPGNPQIAARMGQASGGARPSNLTNNRDALMALLGQPQIQAPGYEAGGMEKTLGTTGLIGSILGALRSK